MSFDPTTTTLEIGDLGPKGQADPLNIIITDPVEGETADAAAGAAT